MLPSTSSRFVSLPLVLATALTGGCLADVEDYGDDEDLLIEGKTSAPVRIVSHNIEKKFEVLQGTLAKAKAIDAHGIALQEVCPDQLQWLRTNYGDEWTIAAVRGKKPALVGCDLPDGSHDYPHSVAIYRGGTNAGGKVYDALGGPANAPGNELACVQFERAKVDVHLCSVHMIAFDWKEPVTGTMYDGAAVREQQAAGIKQIARTEWFDGGKNHFGIVAGDFNSQPNTPVLDKFFDASLGGTGNFTEYNRSGGQRNGEVTAHSEGNGTESGEPYSRKIDYIMFSTNRAPIDGPAVQIIPDESDHDMLVSTVQMKK